MGHSDPGQAALLGALFGVSFRSATWVRILQYFPLGFIFVPLNVASYIGLSADKTNGAAGLMNFTRNISAAA